jgi:6-phosphogluconolactonase
MPRSALGQPSPSKVALYAGIRPELTQYDVDVDSAILVKRDAVTLPANVHYAWPNVSGRYLYVASSNSASGMGPQGDKHHVTAFRIDPESGALARHGDPIPLPTRPIHMTTDIPSEKSAGCVQQSERSSGL